MKPPLTGGRAFWFTVPEGVFFLSKQSFSSHVQGGDETCSCIPTCRARRYRCEPSGDIYRECHAVSTGKPKGDYVHQHPWKFIRGRVTQDGADEINAHGYGRPAVHAPILFVDLAGKEKGLCGQSCGKDLGIKYNKPGSLPPSPFHRHAGHGGDGFLINIQVNNFLFDALDI